MKPIEEKAREYADKQYPNANPYNAPYHTTGDSWDDCNDAFLAGAKEANRWISDRNPENGVKVVVKYKLANGMTKYGIGHHFDYNVDKTVFGKMFADAFGWTIEGSTSRNILGWRPIEL